MSDSADSEYKVGTPMHETMECVVYGAAAGLLLVGVVGAVVRYCRDAPDAAGGVNIAEAYPLATESLTEAGAVDWAGGDVPPAAMRGLALRRELEANWDDIATLFPEMGNICALHGTVIGLAAAETLIGRLFGHPDERFIEAHNVLVWTEWDPTFAAAVACKGVDDALASRAATAWAEVQHTLDAAAAAADVSHPLVRIAASRRRFGNSEDNHIGDIATPPPSTEL